MLTTNTTTRRIHNEKPVTTSATFDTISTYVVNATKGSQTNIKTALWALSTIIFLIVVIVEVVMNFAPIKNEAQKEKH